MPSIQGAITSILTAPVIAAAVLAAALRSRGDFRAGFVARLEIRIR